MYLEFSKMNPLKNLRGHTPINNPVRTTSRKYSAGYMPAIPSERPCTFIDRGPTQCHHFDNHGVSITQLLPVADSHGRGIPQLIKCHGFSINKRLLTGRHFTTNVSTRGILRRLESTEICFRPGLCPRPRWRSSQCSQIPYSRLESP